MCGIAGLIDLSFRSSNEELQDSATRMADTLRHRGPDDEGVWSDAECGIALGFRRLAILDLSAAGQQPMSSTCGRYTIAFNGEIYNFRALRRELEHLGTRFRGHSDTEVLLEGISWWGLQATLKRVNGMFAFALWDHQNHELQLARDRIGEKPLYFGRVGPVFLFGSELKAVRAYPEFQGTINRQALLLYFRYNCIPAPFSIYDTISKLPPATVLTLKATGPDAKSTLAAYWSVEEAALRGVREPFDGPESEALQALEAELRASIALRMEADVPLGAFISGGIDSSTVVALMQAESRHPVRTFSIGFHSDSYDESKQASAVAAHLGTEHTGLTVTARASLDVIPRLAGIYDEPFADSSQIPTYLVSRLARQQVTVCLSGDGGDELFGGYNRHVWVPGLWKRLKAFPESWRAAAGRFLDGLSPQSWEAVFSRLQPVLPGRFLPRHPADKMQKLAAIMRAASIDEMYLSLTSHWKDPTSLVIGAQEACPSESRSDRFALLSDPLHRMMALDTVTYLPDDVLVKVDRASMATSLEARLPLLDHRLFEFAWRLPLTMKMRNGQGKWLLRQVLKRYVPENLTSRPKMGFAIPLDQWLRGPLRDWAEVLLDEKRLQVEGFLNPAPIRERWAEHLCGTRNWQHELWDVLMFQAWLETQ
jgi:asparagine synthase (glutamine-hydrolysing)